MVVDSVDAQRLWAWLDEVDREILYLWAVEGCSASEIAAQMEIARGTVLSRMHRVRRRLQHDRPRAVSAIKRDGTS